MGGRASRHRARLADRRCVARAQHLGRRRGTARRFQARRSLHYSNRVRDCIQERQSGRGYGGLSTKEIENQMIELKSLTKNYGSFTAVDSIDLSVPDGELFGFLGPNGAGKTTTLRMIAGILQPTSGSIHLAGIDLAADPLAAKSKLGFIPDRPFIYEKLTGAEFLRFVAGLYGQDGDKVEHRGRELMALFDLEEWADELVESYSHGMRQKLIISSAFIHRPEVIVVDEPMVGLDPKAARILKDLFREYVRRGHTIMMSTHTLEVAETLCDRIAIIQHGKIRAVGTIQELRTQATGGGGLEEIFLNLTGERAAREAMDVLDA